MQSGIEHEIVCFAIVAAAFFVGIVVGLTWDEVTGVAICVAGFVGAIGGLMAYRRSRTVDE